MITLQLGVVSKKRNSTYIPTTELTETVSACLKDGCSDHNPVFLLSNDSNVFPYNYLKWDNWYYFIDDVVREHNQLVSVHCTIDNLATYKSEILQTSAFVLYDTAANTEIPDTRLSTLTTRGIHFSTGTFNYIGNFSDPSNCPIVLSIVGQDGLSYWAVTPTVAETLLSSINRTELPQMFPSSSSAQTIEEWLEEIWDSIGTFFKALLSSGKAGSCITGAVQLPISSGGIHGNSGSIYLGNLPTGKGGTEISRRICYDTMALSLHWTFSDWRRRNPYTEIYLYCPYFGLISLPVENLIGETGITVECSLDVATGNAIFIVFGTNTQYHIGTYSSNLGGTYAMGGVFNTPFNNVTAMVGATVAGAALLASGGSAAAMAAKLGAASIAGIVGGNTPSLSTVSGGGGGASLGLRKETYLIEVTHDTNVNPSSATNVIGTPTMEVKTLSTLSGYVQTKCASVSISGSLESTNEINDLLDNGIFIE